MRYLIVFSILALAACGVDGEPERPSAPAPGISITGTAELGIAGSN